MPRISQWFIRAALGYLAFGFSLGALLLASKSGAVGPSVWRLLPLHIESTLIGWILQLTMGVAYWIFPRFGMTPAQRGREDLAWLSFWLLNAGVWTVGIAGYAAKDVTAALVGRAAEALGVAFMVVNIWTRTRRSGLSPM